MPYAPQEGRKVSLEEILPEKSPRKKEFNFFLLAEPHCSKMNMNGKKPPMASKGQ